MNSLKSRELFITGENIAAKHMLSCGYTVVCRNFRKQCGEIDLIVEKDQRLVFCEVKTRSSHSINDALASVSYAKQKKISKTAQSYVNQNPQYSNYIFRFDVIVLFYSEQANTFSVKHFEDAFYPILE